MGSMIGTIDLGFRFYSKGCSDFREGGREGGCMRSVLGTDP